MHKTLLVLAGLALAAPAAMADDDAAGYLARVPAAPATLAEALKSCEDTGPWDSFGRRIDFSSRQYSQQALQSQMAITPMDMDERPALMDYASKATPAAHDPQLLLKGPFVQGLPPFTRPAQPGVDAASDKKIYAALEAWVKQAHAWWTGQAGKVKAAVQPPAPFKPKHAEDQALVAGAAAQVAADRLPLVKQLADASGQICETVRENLPPRYLPGGGTR